MGWGKYSAGMRYRKIASKWFRQPADLFPQRRRPGDVVVNGLLVRRTPEQWRDVLASQGERLAKLEKKSHELFLRAVDGDKKVRKEQLSELGTKIKWLRARIIESERSLADEQGR